MHRTNRVPSATLWSVLLGFSIGTAWSATLPATATGQPPKAEPQKPVPVPQKGADALRGNALVLPINGTQILGMKSNKRIKGFQNPTDTVARVQPIDGDPNHVLITGLEPGKTRITLTDVDGAEESFDVVVQFDVEYLRTLLQRAVPTANITPIPAANNTILLTGTVARSEDVDVIVRTAATVTQGADRIVNALRVGGVMQVQLDVVIAAVSRNEVRRMSFEFANFGAQHIVSNGFGGLTLPSQGISGTFPGGPTILNGIGPTQGAPINVFAAVFTPTQDFFGLLQALRDENVVKVMAEPKLVTLSGKPASFLSGGEQAVPVPAGLGQVGVQFEEFGTRLNFLPIVMGNGKIHLEVEPEVSTLDAASGTVIQGTAVQGRVTQRIRTTVELEDGQTFAIGGLIFHGVTGGSRKVPLLGDLPFVGAAFRQVLFNETEQELMVLVTPRLIDAMTCDQLPKYLPGQETRSPDDFELFLEGILEAPRGSRDVCPNHRYRPAFKNGPSADVFPCGETGGKYGRKAGSGSSCGSNCQTCLTAPVAPVSTVATPQVQPIPAPVQQATGVENLPPATTETTGGETQAAPAPAVVPEVPTTPPATPPANEAPGGENRPVVIPPLPPAPGGNPGSN